MWRGSEWTEAGADGAVAEWSRATYVNTYGECRKVIESMRFRAEFELFGNKKDDSFKGSIGKIYQTHIRPNPSCPHYYDSGIAPAWKGDDGFHPNERQSIN